MSGSRTAHPTELRIGFVSAYPPSRRPLSEYGYHLAEALTATKGVGHLSVLSDRAPGTAAPLEGCRSVTPCWTFGSPFLATSVIRAALAESVDVLWFNIHMTSTGNTRASWFGGLCAPAIARAAGFTVVVTLHNMLGLTNLDQSGVRARPWDIAAAHVATRSLGRAHALCVLRPEYLSILSTRYGLTNAVYMPHGTLGTPAAEPVANDGLHVLVFGHFGSYKRLEPVIDAIAAARHAGLPLRLSIGGTDSRHTPGYLDRLSERVASMPDVRILGYVPEPDVAPLFRDASLCILPYATMTGMSGVAMLAATHGVPILASDIPAFRSLEREGFRLGFFDWPSAHSLATAMIDLLSSPERRRALAADTLAHVRTRTMASVAHEYVSLIEMLREARRRSDFFSAGNRQDSAQRGEWPH